ncbi:MAG: universal stress protein [Thermodesulfobacteriota bacterium]|jgi:nucleotide-binding universal stress UspA family protein
MFSPKSILVPTDFSEFSDKALQQAIDIAKQFKGKVYLLHVVGIVIQCAVDYCLDVQTVNEVEQKSINSAKKMAEEQLAKFPDSKLIDISIDIRKGTTYEEILKDEQGKKIDLIVIASHGKTGLRHYLIGSVAEKVVRSAKGPVLLVRG